MKKAIIVHGIGSHGNDLWFPSEKIILESKGYKVFSPTMPGPILPERDIWVKHVSDLEPDEETIIIGHSLGCPTVLRYLETADKTVKKVFLIAPFAKDMGIDFIPVKNFVSDPFNWQKIKMNALEFYVVTQRGDQITPMEYGIDVAQKTGAKLTVVDGDDHLMSSLDLDLINDYI